MTRVISGFVVLCGLLFGTTSVALAQGTIESADNVVFYTIGDVLAGDRTITADNPKRINLVSVIGSSSTPSAIRREIDYEVGSLSVVHIGYSVYGDLLSTLTDINGNMVRFEVDTDDTTAPILRFHGGPLADTDGYIGQIVVTFRDKDGTIFNVRHLIIHGTSMANRLAPDADFLRDILLENDEENIRSFFYVTAVTLPSVAPLTYGFRQTVDLLLPDASGGTPLDDDPTATFSYSLTPTLPAGLAFSPSTQRVTGTAPATVMAATEYTYTAIDGVGSIATTKFTISIIDDKAILETLLATTGTLVPPFNPYVTEYTVNVANSVTQIIISASALHADSSAAVQFKNSASAGTLSVNLELGANVVMVEVTNADSTMSRRYTITVNRMILLPSVPTGLQAVSVGENSVALSWQAPADTGGVDILHYQVWRQRFSDTILKESIMFMVSATANTGYIDTTTILGRIYIYRVAAVNLGGVGAFSDEVTLVTVRGIPDAPIELQVTSIDTTAVGLTWQPPAPNHGTGGIVQRAYQLQRSTVNTFTDAETTTLDVIFTADEGAVLIFGPLQYTDTGLISDTYYYRIAATNSAGLGAFSNVVSANLGASVPDAPTGLQATDIQADRVNLTWQAPADGGSDILSYRITRTPATSAGGGTTTFTISDAMLAYVDEDNALVPKQEYSYTVVAINLIGESVPSDSVSTTLPALSDDASLSAVEVFANGERLTRSRLLTFVLPLTFEPETTHYNVQYYSESDELSFTVTPSNPDATYIIRRIVGSGDDLIDPSNFPPLSRGTLADYDISVTAADGVTTRTYTYTILHFQNIDPEIIFADGDRTVRAGVSVTLDASGTTDPDSIELTFTWSSADADRASIALTGADTSMLTFTAPDDLTTEMSYTFMLSVGDGYRGSDTDAVTITVLLPGVLTVPGVPTQLTATVQSAFTVPPTNNGVNGIWAWSSPRDDGGSAITGYRYELDLGDGTSALPGLEGRNGILVTEMIGAMELSHTEFLLPQNAISRFRIAAINALGQGEFTEWSEITAPPRLPLAPQDVAYTYVSDTEIDLSWSFSLDSDMDTGGVPILSYQLQRSTVDTFDNAETRTFIITPVSPASYSDTGLTRNTQYFYRLAAVSSAGVGFYTPTLMPVASRPTALQATNARGSVVNLTWQAPENTGGVDIQRYRITRTLAATGGELTTFMTTDAMTTYADNDAALVPEQSYSYTVTAVYSAAVGVTDLLGYGFPSAAAVVTVQSDDANLREVTIATGTEEVMLSPSFGAEITEYSSNIARSSRTVVFSYSIHEDARSVSINGVSQTARGDGSYLYLGGIVDDETIFTFVVTAANRVDTRTYTFTVISNLLPVARIADGDRTVAARASVTLDGSGSSDADGDQLTYSWVRVGAMADFPLTGSQTSMLTFTTPNNLITETPYSFIFSVSDGRGGSDTETVTISVLPPTDPGVPTQFMVDTSELRAEWTWAPPLDDGGTDIIGYQYQLEQGHRAPIIRNVFASVTSYAVDLLGNNRYRLRVAASSIQAGGEFTEWLEVNTPAMLPMLPQDFRLTRVSDSETSLAWAFDLSDPSQTGGVNIPILSYQLQRSTDRSFPDSAATRTITVATVASASYRDTSFTQGTLYFYRVAAVNEVGMGAYSPIRSTAIPGTPTDFRAVARNAREVALTWQAPANTGGTQIYILKYEITRRDSPFDPNAGVTTFVTSGINRSHLDRDSELIPGETYSYRLVAINSLAERSQYATTTVTLPPIAPLPPSGIAAEERGTSDDASLREVKVANFFEIEHLPTPSFHPDTTEYRINVDNIIGVLYFDISPGHADATIFHDGNSGTSREDAVRFGVSVGVGTNTYQFIVRAPNEVAMRTYTFTVRRARAGGNRNPLVFFTEPGHHTVMAGELVTIDASLTRDPDGDLLYYQWRSLSAIAARLSLTGGQTNILTFTAPDDLTEEVVHSFTLVVTDDFGGSAHGTVTIAILPPGVPEVPVSLSGVGMDSASMPGRAAATWTWVSGGDGGRDITGYQIEVERATLETVQTTLGVVTSYATDGLIGNSLNRFRVAAVNEHGRGEFSEWSDVTTPIVPAVAPTGLTTTNVQGRAIDLSWTFDPTDPVKLGGISITLLRYQLQRSTVDTFDNAETHMISVPPVSPAVYSDTGLAHGTQYFYRVAAVNSGGVVGHVSETISRTTLTRPPNAPTGLTAMATSASVIDISWVAPEDDGGLDITDYQIERALGGGNFIIIPGGAGGAVLAYRDSGLQSNTQYRYRVSGINQDGTGDVSGIATATTAQSIPGMPTALMATAGSGTSVNLAWNAPANDGGTAITFYRIERAAETGGFTVIVEDHPTASANTYTDIGLATESVYRYQVSAKNSAGAGMPSAVSTVTTNNNIPGAPDSVHATVSGTTVTTTWVAPDDSAEVTGYQVERAVGGGGFTTIAENTDNTDIAYLDHDRVPGTTYRYRVSALSDDGTSMVSAEFSIRVPATAPGVPTGLTATASSSSEIALAWVAPLDTGGATITGYKIERALSSGGFTTIVPSTGNADRTHNDSGLDANTQYRYRVSAINQDATGSVSTIVTATTDPTVPGAPTGVRATTGSGTSVNLAWNAPANNGGATVTAYRIERALGTGGFMVIVENHPATSANIYTDSGLDAATAYRYQVSAKNSAGTGMPSAVSAVTTNDNIPGAPINMRATASGTTVTVFWSSPNGDAVVTGYKVVRATNGNPDFEDIAPDAGLDTSYSDSGRTPGATYRYKVYARSADAIGPASAVQQVRVRATAPGVPTGLVASPTSTTEIDLSWVAPSDDGGAAIMGYKVERALSSGSFTTIASDTGSAARIYSDSGLQANTGYRYRVSAINQDETGSASASIAATTSPLASNAPTGLMATAMDGEKRINLSWTAPTDNGGSSITGYRIQRSVGTQNNFTDLVANTSNTNTTRADSMNIQAGVRYYYQVAAITGAGIGAYSNIDDAVGDNRLPTADAGAATNANEDELVTLDGSGSDDPDGENANLVYNWSLSASTPASISVLLQNAGGAMPTFIAPNRTANYTLTFSLMVTDELGGSSAASDTVEISVTADNDDPIARISGRNNVLAGNTLTLDGSSSSDPDSDTAELIYSWMGGNNVTDGEGNTITGNAVTLSGANTARPVFTAPSRDTLITLEVRELVYAYTLMVSDSNSGTHTSAPFMVTVRLDSAGEIIVQAILPEVVGAIIMQSSSLISKRLKNFWLANGNQPAHINLDGQTFALRDNGVDAQSQPISVGETQGFRDRTTPECTFTDSPHAAVRTSASTRCANPTTTANQKSLTRWLATHGETLVHGDMDMKRMLGNSDFVVPLTIGNGFGSGISPSLVGSVSFWGSGDYRTISAESTDEALSRDLSWDGELFSLQLGVDTRIHADLLGGIAISAQQGKFTYTNAADGAEKNRFDLNLTSVHPYLGWNVDDLNMWASARYGGGELKIMPFADDQQTADLNMTTVSLGGSSMLWESGSTKLRAKGEASLTRLKVEGSDQSSMPIAQASIGSNQLRLGLEANHTRSLSDGSNLYPTAEIGIRHDSGDGEGGTGLVLGVGMKRIIPVLGVTFSGNLHALVGRDNYDEWGISGLVRLDSGADGQGLSLNIVPGYGDTTTDVQSIWQQNWFDQNANQSQLRNYTPRLNAELGYGLSAVQLPGLLTPYAEMTYADTAQSYRFGLRWAHQNLRLNLVGERRQNTNPTNAYLLKGELQF